MQQLTIIQNHTAIYIAEISIVKVPLYTNCNNPYKNEKGNQIISSLQQNTLVLRVTRKALFPTVNYLHVGA